MSFDDFCKQFSATEDEREALLTLLSGLRMQCFLRQTEPIAVILLRTIAAEAERNGSWHVPHDIQERITMFLAERDRRKP